MLQAALRHQLLHQALERHLLVAQGLQHHLPAPRHHLGEARPPRHRPPQRQRVDEEPDQRLHLSPRAPRHRRAHHQVPLPRPAPQEHLERRQQGHEERRAQLPAHPPHRLRRLPAQTHPHRTRPPLSRGARTIRRHLQHRRRPPQAIPPVRHLQLQHRPRQPLPLPAGIVGILHRQLRQLRRPPRPLRRIALRNLPQQHFHRPAVARDVVQRHHHHVLPGRRAHQHRPQHPVPRQVERPPGLQRHRPLELTSATPRRQPRQVHHRQPRPPRRRADHLLRRPLRRPVRGAQHLVASHHPAQRLGQLRHPQLPREAHRRRHVVRRAARLQAVQEPQALLGERQRRPPRSTRLERGRRRRPRLPEVRCDTPRQRRETRRPENLHHRQLHPEDLPHPRHQTGRQQRVPPQGEEVVLGPHPLNAQKLTPLGRQQILLDAQPPVPSPPRCRRRRGQCSSVELAGGSQG